VTSSEISANWLSLLEINWTDDGNATLPLHFIPSCRYLLYRVLEWLRYDAH